METTAPSETTAPAETTVTSVTEPPAETEVTTVTGETSAETTAPSEDTSGDVSNTEETSGTESDIELMSLESGQITVQDITFEPWDSTDTLPGTYGNWYLTDNVTLSSEWTVPTGVVTNLCLNGRTIYTSTEGLEVGAGARLVIYDKEEDKGKISGPHDTIYCSNGFVEINGGTISSGNDGIHNVDGTVMINGGNIEGSNNGIYSSGGRVTIENGMVIASNGSAITNSDDSNIIIRGGTIISRNNAITNNGGTINISGGTIDGNIRINAGTLNIGGRPIITGNPGSNGAIFLKGGSMNLSGSPTIEVTDDSPGITISSGNSININGELTPYDPIKIAMQGVETTYLFAVMDDESYARADNFEAAVEGYTVVKNGKKLYLTKQETHEHNDKVFTPWLDTESLPTESGSYYLIGNVTLSSEWSVPTDGETNLCLNGNTINVGDNAINVDPGAKLNIYNEKENNGQITGNTSSSTTGMININSGDLTVNGGTIQGNGYYATINVEDPNGTVTINGGSIIGDKAINADANNVIITINGGNVTAVSGYKGNIVITGGTIKTNDGYAINGGDTIIKITGKPIISGKNADIMLSSFTSIDIDGELTNTDPYIIDMSTPGVFATGANAKNYAKNFEPSESLKADGYSVTVNADGNLELAQHKHGDTVFMPWSDKTKLPNTAGSWYLTEDVVFPEDDYKCWKVPAGETNLCLNGHSISNLAGSQTITVNNGATLNIYDDDGKEGSINADHYAIRIESGTLTLDGVNISSYNEAIYTHTYSGNVIVSIKNSNIHSTNAYALSIYGGTIEVTGGTITTTDFDRVVSINDNTTAKLDNVNIIINVGRSKGIDVYQSQVTLNKCRITANDNMTECTGIDASNSDITITDSEISVGEDNYSYGIEIMGNSTVTLTDSHIKGGSRGIYCYEGTLEISDNSIVETKTGEYGVYFDEGTFKLSGSPKISGEKADIYLNSGKVITIDGKLAGEYTIDMRTPGVFTSGAKDNATVKNFTPANSDYAVVENSDGELELVKRHYHSIDGKDVEFTAWTKTDSLPTESGYYYLMNDVTIIDRVMITENEDIKICLNGNKITSAADMAYLAVFNNEANLDIYDDTGEGSINNVMVGSYYGTLTLNDVTITREHDIAVQAYDGGTVTLNDTKVNGYADVNSASTLIVNSGTTIGGEVGAGIIVAPGGTVVVNGGDITGAEYGIRYNIGSDSDNAKVIINGGNICGKTRDGILLDGGTLTVTGGKITSDVEAIYVGKTTFNLSGNAVIDGKINVGYSPINITGELTNKEQYEIYMTDPGVFATGAYAAQSAEKFTPSSELATQGYIVTVTENNELAMDYRHYTYDDNGEFKLFQMKPARPVSLDSGIAVISLPENCVLKVNGKTVTDATVTDESTGKYIISVKISRENGFKIGENEIQGLISSNQEQTDVNGSGSYSIKVIVDPKPISAKFADDPTKPYDGNTVCTAEITSDGFVKGDDVSITAESCNFDSANAGTAKIVKASGLKITGEQKDFYKLENDEITGNGKIIPISLDIPAKEFTYNGEKSCEIEFDGVNSEKVTAKLSAYSKNAGAYEYYSTDSTDGHYTVAFFVNGDYSGNYTVGKAYTLTIKPCTAEIDWQKETTFVYDGEEKTVTAVLKNKVENDNAEFELTGHKGTKAGTYTAKVTGITGADKGNYTLEDAENKTLSWKITAAASGMTLSAKEEKVTYGDTVSLTATVKRTAANGIMTMSAEKDKVEFFIGENSIGSGTVSYTDGSSGTAVLELSATSANHFKAGENIIRAEYGGSGNLSGSSAGITITVGKKPVNAGIIGTTTSKVYDGTNEITGLLLQLNGIEYCDKEYVQAEAESYTFNSADVETADTITANDAKLSGEQAENYTLTVDTIEGTITPFPLEIQSYGFTYDGDNVFEIKLNGISGEKLSAKLTAASQNAGTYIYGDSYTIELDNSNYTVDSADPLKIDPLTAKIEWQKETSFDYDGTEKSVSAKVTNAAVAGDTFNIVYENNTATDVGKYTAEITSLGNENYTLGDNTSLNWSIKESKLLIDELPTASAITYGQSLSDSTLTGGIVKNGEITVTGKFEWENGNEKPAVSDSEKTKYTVKFVPDDKNYSDITAEITIEVNKKELVPSVSTVNDKTYDGTTAANGAIELSGAVNGEEPTATGTFDFTDKNAGENKSVNVSGIELDDDWSENYYLSVTSLENVKTSAKISPRTAKIKWQDKTSFVYDGKEKEVTAKVINAAAGDTFNIVYENNKKTDAGKYTAKITSLSNDNYTLDGAENVTLSWKISPADSEETNVTINYFNETLSTSSDMEYSIDGATWLPCTENMSVTAFGWKGTESLTVKIRYAKDNNHNAGAAQTVVIPARPAAPDISGITVTKTQASITVTKISGCEYSIDGVKWQNSGKFSGLTAGTEYTVQIRTKATENAFASFAADKEIVTSDTSSGATDLKAGETVETGNGSITNDGKNVEIEDKNRNKTTVTLPNGASDSVEIDESGNVQVPDGSIVQSGNTTVELPDGGTVKPDGTITADKVSVGNTTVSGDEVTVDKDGNITVSENGTVQNGDSTVELPNGGTVKPDGTITADKVSVGNTTVSGEEVTVDKDGNITVSGNGKVQDGDTIVTGEKVTVDKDGNITLPNGGIVNSADRSETVIGKDGSIKNSEVSIEPVNNIDYYDENNEAHSLKDGYIVLDIEPVKDVEISPDISVIAAYDIRLLYNGEFEVEPTGTVKVTMAAPEGADGTEKVMHLNGNSVEDMNAAYDLNANTFSFETDHFSIYVIAETEVSDEPTTPPSISPTIPDRPSAAPAATENTDNNDGEDVSSGAEIISSDEKIGVGIAGNGSLKNIFGYLSALAIAAAAAFIAKRKRQK